MSVVQKGPVILLEGVCRVEDAEILAALLQRKPGSTVDFTRCQELHTAVVQAILAFGPPMTGTSTEPFLRDLLLPILASKRQSPLPEL